MKGSTFSRYLTEVLRMAMVLLALGRPAQADFSPGYLHERNHEYKQALWMSELPDDRRLDEINMVGTHDSGAVHGGDAVACQTMGIRDQLKMGVRVLDMRCHHKNNTLLIYHGVFDQKQTGREFMQQVVTYLKDYPTETVLVRVKKEGDAEGCSHGFVQDFREQVFDFFEAQKPGIFWKGGPMPTMKEVRGKVVILYNFGDWTAGWNYAHAMDIQDMYALKTNWDLYAKWEAVKAQLEKAYQQGPGRGLVMNYLSASTGSFPYFVASGKSSPGTLDPQLATGLTTPGWKNSYPDFPRISCFLGVCSIVFDGTNHLTYMYIPRLVADCQSRNGGNLGKMYLGILMADFVGPDLIDRVIKTNLLIHGQLPRGDY